MEERAIPTKKNIKISLNKAVPSGYPISKLKGHLTELGLTCGETDEERLKEYKKEVMANFKSGEAQIFSMINSSNTRQINSNLLFNPDGSFTNLSEVEFFAATGMEELKETGSWTVYDDAKGYRAQLSTIVKHFDLLASQRPGYFNGEKNHVHRVINEPTGQAIRDTFSSMSLSVTSIMPGGINELDLETLVSTMLNNNQSANPKDYVLNDERTTFVVYGYDPIMDTSSSIGALLLQYSITIKDYKDKGDNKSGRYNDAILDITGKFVCYSEVEDMYRDYNYVGGRFARLFAPLDEQAIVRDLVKIEQKGNPLLDARDIPSKKKKLIVYEQLPAAGDDVLNSGMPLVSNGPYVESLIFYCPEFENLAYLDNRESEVDTSYTKSVTVGFETSTQVAISMETSMDLDLTIIKFGFRLGINMSVTSAYNESHTESITFNVPAGKQAYLYRGRMLSIVLRYDPEKMTYRYVYDSKNVFLSNAVKTTLRPIVDSQV